MSTTPSDAGDHRVALNRLAAHFARDRHVGLRRRAHARGARPAEVDDVIQAALVAFLRFYPGDPRDEHGAWLYLLQCVNTAVSKAHRTAHRRDSRHVGAIVRGDELVDALEHQVDVGAVDPADRAIALEQARAAAEALAQLPGDQRAVVLLRAAGFSPAETAERLGLSPRAVRKRVEKANRALANERGA